MSVQKLKTKDLSFSFDFDLKNIGAKDDKFISQDRIENALKKLVAMRSSDYNAYISGSLSKNDKEIVKKSIEKYVENKKIELYDYCFVNNFETPKMPKVIKLKQGDGKIFAKEMDKLVAYLTKNVPSIFESKEYESRIQAVIKYYDEQHKKIYDDMQTKANELDFVVKMSPAGITINPVVSGRVIGEMEFVNLSKEIKDEIETKRKKLEDDINNFLRKSRDIEKEKQKKIKKINDEMGIFVVGHKIDEIKELFKYSKDIEQYLEEVEEYTLNNIFIFLPHKESGMQFMPVQNKYTEYKVNLFVDNEQNKKIPVIYEENPTFYNIFGKLEKQAYFGSFVTNFTNISAGSIHKANGGYLILDAAYVLSNPGVWETLKKTLFSKKSTIEELGEKYGMIAYETLKPEPIELDINIVLIGSEYLYQLLYDYDKDFSKLFKLKTNFNYIIDRDKNSINQYISKILSFCEENKLAKPDKSGFDALLKYSCRLSGDRKKMWAYFDDVTDIVRESQTDSDKEEIDYEDIQKAIYEKRFLKDLWKEKIYEMVEDGTIIIDLKGEKIGQINGLSVVDYGDYAFGRVNKIAAKTFAGKDGVINIEREAKLSGKIFDKASHIIAGFIGNRYGLDKLLNFSATISFEQSYSYIEGDSASIAETLALLSSFAEIGLKQNIAVTGSMNQDGIIQPIGGVNEKIEGFYEICKLTGNLKGSGVAIPKLNVKNLILSDEIIESVGKKEFNIYTLETIDDAIQLFTSKKAGKKVGRNFEKGSFNYFVNKKLKRMSNIFVKD